MKIMLLQVISDGRKAYRKRYLVERIADSAQKTRFLLEKDPQERNPWWKINEI